MKRLCDESINSPMTIYLTYDDPIQAFQPITEAQVCGCIILLFIFGCITKVLDNAMP